MASASRADVELTWDDLPLLPGTLQCAADGILPGAVERNKESSAQFVTADDDVTPAMLDICFDAQTSGGLLIAVEESKADALLKRLHDDNVAEAAVIGRVIGPGSGRVTVRTEGRRRLPAPRPAPAAPRARVARSAQAAGAESCCSPQEANLMGCCEEDPASGGQAPPAQAEARSLTDTKRQFQDFMKAAAAPGALDARSKRAAAIALSTLAKCEPCLKSHVAKAKQEGFSEEEIDEAAWLAVSFGGCPIMMFYNSVRKS
jgi:AhpD family alkylhydroperoxidase